MKTCSKCSSEKEDVHFNKCSRNKCGLQSFCKPCKKVMSRARYIKNSKRILAINEAWRNSNKEFKAIINKEWASNNKGMRRASSAKRRANKKKATPIWADIEAIKLFYINCPEGYEVDHIVPLQGVSVRGLHILHNLQYLTISENRSKGNKYESNT